MLSLFSKNSHKEQMNALKLATNVFLTSSIERYGFPTLCIYPEQ